MPQHVGMDGEREASYDVSPGDHLAHRRVGHGSLALRGEEKRRTGIKLISVLTTVRQPCNRLITREHYPSRTSGQTLEDSEQFGYGRLQRVFRYQVRVGNGPDSVDATTRDHDPLDEKSIVAAAK